MKSYTDIVQSKKLADILPLESADMWYQHVGYQHIGMSIKDGSERPIYFPMVIRDCESDKDIPCWSLTALLSVLPRIDIEREICSDDKYEFRVKAYIGDGYIGDWYDNPIDACVEMILKLHELNLL